MEDWRRTRKCQAFDLEGALVIVNKFPCPCCGYRVFEDPPGSHMICPICFWEDDILQLRWPFYGEGANQTSLVQAQINYNEFAASARRFRECVREPKPGEERGGNWRPIEVDRDRFEPTFESWSPWPKDRTVLYWWSDSFWLNRPFSH
ncbi:CPCC family cysteine-rich protein [Streptosporangium sp. NPDC051022]|uniref:CPCC family cysteine-rich protein n=1 Tax=Streptosporangium sp. NPDC051022 TaxID=3155752 RepID=UPI00343D42A3